MLVCRGEALRGDDDLGAALIEVDDDGVAVEGLVAKQGSKLYILDQRSDADGVELTASRPPSGRDRCRSVHRRVEAGHVVINGAPHEPQAPFGGFKQSGIGRETGDTGLLAYLKPKVVRV